MYPLDDRSRGPTVRIGHLAEALAGLVDVDLVDGDRGPRRLALARYVARHGLDGLDGMYVESSTALPSETDVAVMGLAARRTTVLTYVRDAYQLFDEYAVGASPKRRLARAAFRPAIRALRAASTALAFPTRGLAVAVLGAAGSRAPLLPPGAPAPASVHRSPTASRLLYVGAASLPAHGVDRLVAAVELARRDGSPVELDIVCRPGEGPPGAAPSWMRVHHRTGDGIEAMLGDVVATVIPRPRTAYNDLALPIKLFEFLAYGRPLIVTDCIEQADVVRGAGAGVVTGDSPAELAVAIGQVVAAPPDQLDAWSAAGHRAALDASWEHRARRVLELMGIAV